MKDMFQLFVIDQSGSCVRETSEVVFFDDTNVSEFDYQMILKLLDNFLVDMPEHVLLSWHVGVLQNSTSYHRATPLNAVADGIVEPYEVIYVSQYKKSIRIDQLCKQIANTANYILGKSNSFNDDFYGVITRSEELS